jgi:uncharacterized protein with beta-barrel porin domain
MQASDSTKLRGMLGWRHAFGDTTPISTHAFGGSLPFTGRSIEREGCSVAPRVRYLNCDVHPGVWQCMSW